MNGFDKELYVATVATATIIINYANDVAEFGTEFSKITDVSCIVPFSRFTAVTLSYYVLNVSIA